MAPRSKISKLPKSLQDEFFARMAGSNYSNYDEHTAWLHQQICERGIEVDGGIPSRAAVARAGKKQQSISETIQKMRRLEKEFSTEPLQTNRLNNHLIQLMALAKSHDAYEGDVSVPMDFLKDMSLTIGRLEKASAINEDRERDIRDDERKLAQAEAAAKVDDVIKSSKGSNSDTIAKIREAIAGGLSA